MPQPSNKDLELYALSKKLAYTCYALTDILPAEEKSISGAEIRKAAIYMHMNMAAALSRPSKKKRRKYFKTAKDYLVMIEAATNLLLELKYTQPPDISELDILLQRCYRFIKKQLKNK